MTCIVGWTNGKNVYMSGDLMGSSEIQCSRVTHQKVFKREIFINKIRSELLIGYTTSFAMGQMLEHHFEIPDMNELDPYIYLIKDFIPKLKKFFENEKFSKITDNVIEGGTFLLGIKGRLFIIEDDFQCFERADKFAACGCGESYAIPLLDYIINNREKIDYIKKSPDDKFAKYLLIEALKQAEKHSPFVGYVNKSIIFKV